MGSLNIHAIKQFWNGQDTRIRESLFELYRIIILFGDLICSITVPPSTFHMFF